MLVFVLVVICNNCVNMKRQRGDDEEKEENKNEKTRIGLNVGGKIFYTSKSTLTSQEGFFTTLFSSSIPTETDNDGNIWIDRDPEIFPYILNFLRTGLIPKIDDLFLLRRICSEADFFQLGNLSEALNCDVLYATYDDIPSCNTEVLYYEAEHENTKYGTQKFKYRNIYFFVSGIELETKLLRTYFIWIHETAGEYRDVKYTIMVFVSESKKKKWVTMNKTYINIDKPKVENEYGKNLNKENYFESKEGKQYLSFICKFFGLKE